MSVGGALGKVRLIRRYGCGILGYDKARMNRELKRISGSGREMK
jgi:hypothetical protein